MKIIYDIDCLLYFLKIKRTDLLEELFSHIVISNKVFNSLNNPSIPDFIKDKLNELVDTEFGKAIRIVKTNDAGYITVTPKKPLIVPKGARLQGYVHYTSATNDPEYSVGVVRLMNRHRKLYYFNGLDERGTGGPKMHLLINTAPGTRERKTCRYLADDRAGTNVLPAIAVIAAIIAFAVSRYLKKKRSAYIYRLRDTGYKREAEWLARIRDDAARRRTWLRSRRDAAKWWEERRNRQK